MIKENFKWKTHKKQSTDAEHRGGVARSSDENCRKAEGAKGLHRSVVIFSQPGTGGANEYDEIV